MENYRTIVLSVVVLVVLGGGFLFSTINAYSPDTTHRALGNEMVDFYNLKFPRQALNSLGKRVIMQGSQDEDSLARQAFHFYDPVYNRGVKFGIRWASSKRWAQDHKLQSKRDPKMLAAGVFLKPFSGISDYSWERSIYEYTWGSKARGLKGLGQVLHLLQDLAVPDHTRDDPHPPLFEMGSPYEQWADQFNSVNLNVVSEIRRQDPLLFSTLDEYFDSLAKYSNSNFFSKDTIFSERYKGPIVDFEKREILSDGNDYLFGYVDLPSGESFRLVQIKRGKSWQEPEYSIDDSDKSVLSDYWSLLSKQAVLHGAGVIKLFFEEVEKERRTEKLLTYNRNPADKLIAAASSLFSPTKKLQYEGILDKNLDFIDDISPSLVSAPDPPKVLVRTFSETPPPPIVAEAVPPTVDIIVDEVRQSKKNTKEVKKSNLAVSRGGVGGSSPAFDVPASPSSSTDPPDAPGLTSPSDFSSIFTTDTIAFSGTSTSGAIISNSFNSATTTADGTGDWSVTINIAQGTTTIGFIASNAAGSSPATEVITVVDSMGPNLSDFTISECANSVASNGCLIATTSINLSWEASNDAISYTIECSSCGSGFPKTTSTTSTVVQVSEQAVHTFTLKSQDSLGNKTSLSSQQVEYNLRPVVINEIAWMGTVADATDEWIELFNVSSFDINFGTSTATSTWVLVSDDTSPNVSLEGTIVAGGFFILERTASTTMSYNEDQIYTGALTNDGENLSLKDKNGITIDSISALNIGWFAGDNTTKQTMERIGPGGDGGTYNWQTASSSSSFLDIGGNAVLGTPGAQNSAYNLNWNPTFISDDTVISANTTWSNNSSPYILESNSNQFPTVSSGATLTIEDSSVLMSLSSTHSAIRVEGNLNVEGTSGNEVVFTFYDDADYGGATAGAKGKWKGIEFASGSSSTVNYARFRYGGGGTTPSTTVEIEPSTSVTFNNSVFEQNNGIVFNMDADDITLEGDYSGVAINDSTFLDNGVTGLEGSGAIVLDEVSGPTLSSNTFTNNIYAPVKMLSSYPALSGNSASGNFYNGIFVEDDTVLATNTTWAASLPYVVEANSNRRVTVAASTTLTINPGVIVKALSGANEAFRVEGSLVWEGAVGNPGVFTSLYDDANGGDTNNDGATTTASAGDWKDFRFTAGSTGTLSNIKFLYGSDATSTTTPGLLKDVGANVTTDNLIFE